MVQVVAGLQIKVWMEAQVPTCKLVAVAVALGKQEAQAQGQQQATTLEQVEQVETAFRLALPERQLLAPAVVVVEQVETLQLLLAELAELEAAELVDATILLPLPRDK
jgi:hypothetical protein